MKAKSTNIQNDVERGNCVDEKYPLLGHRPIQKANGINYGILGLFILLIGSVTIGQYLIHQQSKPQIEYSVFWNESKQFHSASSDSFTITSTFDLVNRDVWGAKENIARGNQLNAENVRHVIVFQTKGNSCNSFLDCVQAMRDMQVC